MDSRNILDHSWNLFRHRRQVIIQLRNRFSWLSEEFIEDAVSDSIIELAQSNSLIFRPELNEFIVLLVRSQSRLIDQLRRTLRLTYFDPVFFDTLEHDDKEVTEAVQIKEILRIVNNSDLAFRTVEIICLRAYGKS